MRLVLGMALDSVGKSPVTAFELVIVSMTQTDAFWTWSGPNPPIWYIRHAEDDTALIGFPGNLREKTDIFHGVPPGDYYMVGTEDQNPLAEVTPRSQTVTVV